MNESFEIIYSDLHLEAHSEVSESELLKIISDRVAYFLENDKDLLLSYLYRLDIEEKHIDDALNPAHALPAHIALGQLILDRQKQRQATKMKYPVEPIEGWEF